MSDTILHVHPDDVEALVDDFLARCERWDRIGAAINIRTARERLISAHSRALAAARTAGRKAGIEEAGSVVEQDAATYESPGRRASGRDLARRIRALRDEESAP